MSWGLEVPEGWRPGEPLRVYGRGPRYACFASRSVWEPMPPYGVTFDCYGDFEKFRDWWFAGRFELSI